LNGSGNVKPGIENIGDSNILPTYPKVALSLSCLQVDVIVTTLVLEAELRDFPFDRSAAK
jgi:hypothetical protein